MTLCESCVIFQPVISANGGICATLPPRTADHGERGRGEQLRARPLHHRQRTHRRRPGPNSQIGRPVHRAPGYFYDINYNLILTDLQSNCKVHNVQNVQV